LVAGVGMIDSELDYRLIKEIWAASGDRIAVRFAYEWHDEAVTGSARTATRTGSSTETG
jgi:nuclear transport factor 2 (NTF2) superfamily protein